MKLKQSSLDLTLKCLIACCYLLTFFSASLEALYTSHTGSWNNNGLGYISDNPQMGQDSSTPKNNSVCKSPNGQFADPQYCDKYYDCWDGRPVSSGQCSHGLVFNEQTASCDYPSMVNCDGKEIAKPLQDADGGCEQPYGTFPNTADCRYYIVCHAGKASYFKCGDGLAYDTELGVCAPPKDPSCLDKPSDPQEIPLDPESIKPAPPSGPSGGGGGSGGGGNGDITFPIIPEWPSTTKCPVDTGFIPIVKDCQSVLVCIGGIGYLFNCPKGEFYSPKHASCKVGKAETCEQMDKNLPTTRAHNFAQIVHGAKYGYLSSRYPVLPF